MKIKLKSLFFYIFLNIITLHIINGQEEMELKLDFVVKFNKDPLKKHKWYISDTKDSLQISVLKFYLTNFELKYKTKSIPLVGQNYLIDCFNKKEVKLKIPKIDLKNDVYLICDLGVDEKLNTSGANSKDLDPVNGMFWSWQSGYINFKIEGISPSCNTRKNRFIFHIGGYKSPFETIQKLSFKLKNINDNHLLIDLELSNFFDLLDLNNENQITTTGENASRISDQLKLIFNASK